MDRLMMVVDMLVVIMVLVLVIIQTNRQESSTLHLKLLDGDGGIKSISVVGYKS